MYIFLTLRNQFSKFAGQKYNIFMELQKTIKEIFLLLNKKSISKHIDTNYPDEKLYFCGRRLISSELRVSSFEFRGARCVFRGTCSGVTVLIFFASFFCIKTKK